MFQYQVFIYNLWFSLHFVRLSTSVALVTPVGTSPYHAVFHIGSNLQINDSHLDIGFKMRGAPGPAWGGEYQYL